MSPLKSSAIGAFECASPTRLVHLMGSDVHIAASRSSKPNDNQAAIINKQREKVWPIPQLAKGASNYPTDDVHGGGGRVIN